MTVDEFIERVGQLTTEHGWQWVLLGRELRLRIARPISGYPTIGTSCPISACHPGRPRTAKWYDETAALLGLSVESSHIIVWAADDIIPDEEGPEQDQVLRVRERLIAKLNPKKETGHDD